MIRTATPDDAAAVARIYGYFVEHTAVSFEEEVPSHDEMRRRMVDVLKALPWLVAEDEEQVIGYAYALPHTARASYRWSVNVSIYLDPAALGRGVGRQLYTELLAILREQGYRRAHAGITLPNDASVGIHTAFGFQPVGTYPNVGYKFGTWHNTFWMSLELLPPIIDPPEPTKFPDVTRTTS